MLVVFGSHVLFISAAVLDSREFLIAVVVLDSRVLLIAVVVLYSRELLIAAAVLDVPLLFDLLQWTQRNSWQRTTMMTRLPSCCF